MPFTFVSGNLALDFAGTVLHRRTAAEDLLSAPRLLGDWSVAAGLVDRRPEVSAAEFGRALTLREAVYRLALASAAGGQRSRDDLDVVNAAAAPAPVTALLTESGLERTGTADAVVATIARAAVAVLGGPDAARIRECGDQLCTRLFVDTSRAGSRQWCEMSGCGNRAKVAGFRARREGGRAVTATPGAGA
jgi:predicted RNA-binding Zn ribbon-like protein